MGKKNKSSLLSIMFFSLAAFLVSEGSQAAFDTGNSLLSDCESKKSDSDWGYCIGYIIGSFDMSEGRELNGFRYCAPKTLTKGQVRDVTIKFLQGNPKERHFVGSSLVIAALADAFPCNSSTRSPSGNSNPFR